MTFHLPAYTPISKTVSGLGFKSAYLLGNSQLTSPDAKLQRGAVFRDLQPRACWVACTVGNPEMVASCSFEGRTSYGKVAACTHI